MLAFYGQAYKYLKAEDFSKEDFALEDDGILLDLATTEFERMCDWKRVEKEVNVIKPSFLGDNNYPHFIRIY